MSESQDPKRDRRENSRFPAKSWIVGESARTADTRMDWRDFGVFPGESGGPIKTVIY